MEGSGQREHDILRPGEIAGALAWWREAGVDLDFADSPRPWLASPEPEAQTPAHPRRSPSDPVAEPVAPSPAGGFPDSYPADLAAFREWWLTEPSLAEGGTELRVPPRGPTGAPLMIVVGQPEAEDRDELLSGPEGRLLGAMLAAMGLAPETVYLASALPRPTPLPDWAAIARAELGSVLRHHVALVRPERLLVFGSGVLSLLGNDPAQTAQNSPRFYHEGQSISLLAARELGSLGRPAWKARFWREWLDWTGTATE